MTKAELYKKACMLPLLPGVYIIRDKSDTIIYIGKAKRLKTRVSQYFREGVPHDAKVSQMIAHAFTFDVIVCQSEFEALVLEASQIKAHTPKYNILLKDDKGYSYVKVTRGAWPRCRRMTTTPTTSARSRRRLPCGRWWKRRRTASCCRGAIRAFRRISARAAPASTPTSASAWPCAAAKSPVLLTTTLCRAHCG